MRPSRFTEEQIIGMLKEQEAGAATADVCRKHGISSATFYKFKAKYGGMDVSDARRLFPINHTGHDARFFDRAYNQRIDCSDITP